VVVCKVDGLQLQVEPRTSKSDGSVAV